MAYELSRISLQWKHRYRRKVLCSPTNVPFVWVMKFQGCLINVSRNKAEKVLCSPSKGPLIIDWSQSKLLPCTEWACGTRCEFLGISLQWQPRCSWWGTLFYCFSTNLALIIHVSLPSLRYIMYSRCGWSAICELSWESFKVETDKSRQAGTLIALQVQCH